MNSGQPLTLFAAVQGIGSTEPTGTVTFYSGSSLLGTATLNATGVATLNFTPAAGTYTVTANYNGDAVYATSVSAVLGTVTVGQATQFSLTSNPSSLSVQSKKFGLIDLTLASVSGFTDQMVMGCLGLPSGASCTFNTTQVSLSANGTKTVQMTLDTADPLTSGGQAKVENTSSTTMVCALPAGMLVGFLLWTAFAGTAAHSVRPGDAGADGTDHRAGRLRLPARSTAWLRVRTM